MSLRAEWQRLPGPVRSATSNQQPFARPVRNAYWMADDSLKYSYDLFDSIVHRPEHFFPREVVEWPPLRQKSNDATRTESLQQVFRLDDELDSTAAGGDRNIFDF